MLWRSGSRGGARAHAVGRTNGCRGRRVAAELETQLLRVHRCARGEQRRVGAQWRRRRVHDGGGEARLRLLVDRVAAAARELRRGRDDGRDLLVLVVLGGLAAAERRQSGYSMNNEEPVTRALSDPSNIVLLQFTPPKRMRLYKRTYKYSNRSQTHNGWRISLNTGKS